eukprot:7004803-Lingulodinium_polyedra.AAC.1
MSTRLEACAHCAARSARYARPLSATMLCNVSAHLLRMKMRRARARDLLQEVPAGKPRLLGEEQ